MAESASYIKEAHFKPTIVIRDWDIERRAIELFTKDEPGRSWSYDGRIGVRDHLNPKPERATIDEIGEYREKAIKSLIDEQEGGASSPA